MKKNSPIIALAMIVIGLVLLFSQPLMNLMASPEIETEIDHSHYILPAAYKVYANENALEGKYRMFKMLLTNTGKKEAKDVEVSFDIPGYIESTVVDRIPILLPGQSVVVNAFPKFKEDIVEKRTPSKEKVSVKVTGNNFESVDEQFTIEIRGRNEMIYSFIPVDEIRTPGEAFDNSQLISCFVTPEDPIIKYYTQQIQEKVLKGETASVENKEEEGVRFLKGIYDATYLSHMVYSGTSGVPDFENGIMLTNQNLRLPREVVTGKTGLCIELSILYASVMMAAGMDAVIFLVPGHAYPGFRMNNNFYAIESTSIGGEGMGGRSTSDEALKSGMEQLQEFIGKAMAGDDRYEIIDIRQAQKNGAIAMELQDDPFLRQKIDEIAKSFENAEGIAAVQPIQVALPQPTGGAGGGAGTGGGNTGTAAGYQAYNGNVSFSYPNIWQNRRTDLTHSLPQLRGFISEPNGTANIQIYEFPGASSPEQALQILQQQILNMGSSIQYSVAGKSGNFTVAQGITSGGGPTPFQWTAAFKPVNGGVAGITIGAYQGYEPANYQQQMITILNSLR